jgi:hypothetical protein
MSNLALVCGFARIMMYNVIHFKVLLGVDHLDRRWGRRDPGTRGVFQILTKQGDVKHRMDSHPWRQR